jgi:hypothetical protein
MSDDKVLKFERTHSAMEVMKNEYEDDNVEYAIICMVTKDGDFYIMDSGEDADLISVSYFAEYFERQRQNILDNMFDADEIVD